MELFGFQNENEHFAWQLQTFVKAYLKLKLNSPEELNQQNLSIWSGKIDKIEFSQISNVKNCCQMFLYFPPNQQHTFEHWLSTQNWTHNYPESTVYTHLLQSHYITPCNWLFAFNENSCFLICQQLENISCWRYIFSLQTTNLKKIKKIKPIYIKNRISNGSFRLYLIYR